MAQRQGRSSNRRGSGRVPPLYVRCPEHGRHHFEWLEEPMWWRCPVGDCERVVLSENLSWREGDPTRKVSELRGRS